MIAVVSNVRAWAGRVRATPAFYRFVASIVATSVAMTAPGCSFVMTRGPSTSDPAADPSAGPAKPCTPEMTFPILDGVGAAVVLVALGSAISSDKRSSSADDVGGATVFGGFLIAGAATAGAIVGYGRVTRCRNASSAPAERPPHPAPPPHTPPPAPPASSLGTEGDVCATQSECAPSFTCTANVCLRAR